MNISLEQITAAVLALPSEQRAELADRLVESLDPVADAKLRESWSAEALRRLEEIRSGSVSSISSEEAWARIRPHVSK